jgi:integrase
MNITVKTRYRADTGRWTLDYFNPAGRRRRLTVGSEQEAQKISARFTDWLLDGKDPEREIELAKRKEGARETTLREFFPVFMERHGDLQGIKTRELYKGFFKNFSRCPRLVDGGLSDITKAKAVEYARLRINQDQVSPATANREISLLRNIISRAVEWEILDRNPLSNYRMMKEADKRDVFITPEQVEKLLDLLSPALADIVEFAVYTGLRKDNILGLRIEQVMLYDLQKGGEIELTVKGGKRRRKALGSRAAQIIARNTKGRDSGYVFLNPATGSRYTSINRTFDRWVKRLGLEVNGTKLRFHDLRHITASWLNQRGVSLDTLRHLLDHEDRSTTDRYTTPDLMALGKAMDLMPEIRRRA